MRNVPSLETVHHDYAAKGVKFFYIYKALAHPENNGYVQPFNLKERLMHVAEAKRTLGSKIPWICDSMDNDLKHALGDRPNSEFIIDPDGKIVVARGWSSPQDLRSDLAGLVGEVTPATPVSDLKMKKLPPVTKPSSGVVARIQLPGQSVPLKTKPVESSGTPHYCKLRVESSGDKIYLGFFLDPLYKVHWNNKAPALEYSIEVPDGLALTPSTGTASKVNVDADNDPREFLLDASGHTEGNLIVTVKYFACDDAETFCKPVTQKYVVTAETDRDGGSRRAARGMGRGGPPGSSRGGVQPSFQQMVQRLDRNRDGKLSINELPPQMQQMLRGADKNNNGIIEAAEMQAARRRRGR